MKDDGDDDDGEDNDDDRDEDDDYNVLGIINGVMMTTRTMTKGKKPYQVLCHQWSDLTTNVLESTIFLQASTSSTPHPYLHSRFLFFKACHLIIETISQPCSLSKLGVEALFQVLEAFYLLVIIEFLKTSNSVTEAFKTVFH